MNSERLLAISKTLNEHHTHILDALEKINELYEFIDDQRKSFERFKLYMEEISKEIKIENSSDIRHAQCPQPIENS